MGIKLLVCGSGHSSHVFAVLASTRPEVDEVRVLTMTGDKAERWTASVKEHDLTATFYCRDQEPETIHGKPTVISKDPATVVAGCDMIVLAIAAVAHAKYLQALKPHVTPGTVLVGIPGAGGFDWEVKKYWGDLASQCTLMSFETLPWACRLVEFGKAVAVSGTKHVLSGSMVQPANSKSNAVEILQNILGDRPKLEVRGHLLSMSLMAANTYLHPPIMYGTWCEWDGSGLESPPTFYHGLNKLSANTMSAMSDEALAIANAIMQQKPEVDLANVSHMRDWFIKCYGEYITDSSSLYTSIQTNTSYSDSIVPLVHPMKKGDDGKFTVDFSHRYMEEDIPFGLVVLKGIGVIAGVRTSTIDKVITWAQGIMGKEYLVNGELVGKDILNTRAPQAYGITSLHELITTA